MDFSVTRCFLSRKSLRADGFKQKLLFNLGGRGNVKQVAEVKLILRDSILDFVCLQLTQM